MFSFLNVSAETIKHYLFYLCLQTMKRNQTDVAELKNSICFILFVNVQLIYIS